MQAAEKLRNEMEQNKNHKYVQVVGNFLLGYLAKNSGAAEQILAEGKTIKGSLEEMKKEARKSQADNVGVLTDEEGFAVVLQYYGITGAPGNVPAPATAPASDFDVKLDDLL